MEMASRWRVSTIVVMVSAATAWIGFEALNAEVAQGQQVRTKHPRRPAPAAVPQAAAEETARPSNGGAVDPGVRRGSVDSGQILTGLYPEMGLAELFEAGADAFADINSVFGTIPGEPDSGLGPRFNANGCGACHSQPALGGTSPTTKHFPFVGPNPQVAAATLQGATNRVPYFITAEGPVREARFKFVVRNGQLTSQPDGGVHQLYTIQGRSDATNTVGVTGKPQTCRLPQPDFEQARRLNNIEFRIPTPTFGLGLIESISDAAIIANMNAHTNAKNALGISGRPNRNDNDGTITRFGWKAQNASLVVFSAEAYNVEQGVSNEGFTQERDNPGGPGIPVECLFNTTPEDRSIFSGHADVPLFAAFMRLLAAPRASTTSPGGAGSIQRGSQLFSSVGCGLCHTPSLPVAHSTFFTGHDEARLFSDLLLHDMGPSLGDGISQGRAGPNEFRTAPLWGLGQRIFFLHDGRTSNLVEAIQWHGGRGSEARDVTGRFFSLSEGDKQHVLNFLRSL
jgi:CxxC motif-containing protein (DUF1111 family)